MNNTLFEINDGATHWVSAQSMDEALSVYAETVSGTVEKYIEEVCDGEHPEITVYTKDKLHVLTQDGPDLLDGFPRGAYLQIVIPRSSYKDLATGVIATTEY